MSSETLSIMQTQLSNTTDAQNAFSIWNSLKACGAQQWELDVISVTAVRLTVYPLHKLCLSAFRLVQNLHNQLVDAIVVLLDDGRSLSCQLVLKQQKYVNAGHKKRDYALLGNELKLASKFPAWADRSDRRLLTRLLNGLCRVQDHVPVLDAKLTKSDDNARVTLCVSGYSEVNLCVLRQLLETQFADCVQDTEVLCSEGQLAVHITVVRTNVVKRKRD